MQIEKVIDQDDSYLVNDSTSVPKEEDNSDYKAIQKWIAEGNKILVKSDEDILQEAKKEKITQCRAYLDKTDWYIIRLADSGDVIPTEVKEKRTLARDNQNLIESSDCDTLEKLNNINTDF